MLIQALCQYYDMNKEKVTGGAPKYFEKFEVSHRISLSSDGKIVDIQDVSDKKLEMFFPKRPSYTSIESYYAEHRPEYIFGLSQDKDNLFVDKSSKDKHDAFLNKSMEFCNDLDTPMINAFKNFMINWKPESETENTILKKLVGAHLYFSLDGHPDILLHEDEKYKSKYINLMKQEDIEKQKNPILGFCPIKGDILLVPELHYKVNGGIWVCVNEESAESYNKNKAYISGISTEAMDEYTATLKYLLNSSLHHIKIEDTFIFYFGLSSDDEEECAYFSNFYNTEKSADNELDKNLNRVALDMKEGAVSDISVFDSKSDFIIAGYTLNKARVAIKFQLRSSFGNIMKNLLQHQKDIHIDNYERNISMKQIFSMFVKYKKVIKGKNIKFEKVSKKDKGAMPPLQSAIMQAALNGTHYPDSMFNLILQRIRTDMVLESSYGRIRCGLLKAYLNRKARLSNNKEEITLALNKENNNPAYLCGRLFAVLEKIQQNAYGDSLNRTIKDSFFASACARPVSVFPRLLKLSQNHIAKLDKDSYWQKLIGEIMNGIEGQFPQTMTPDDQGRFIIGYYQQRQEFFSGKNTETGKED